MDKSAFSVVPLSAESDEREYWLSRTPQERLEALEAMRQIVMATTHLPPDFRGFSRSFSANRGEDFAAIPISLGHLRTNRISRHNSRWERISKE